MQWVLSRIWTRDVVFIPYDDNHYTTGTTIDHMIHASQIRSYENFDSLEYKLITGEYPYIWTYRHFYWLAFSMQSKLNKANEHKESVNLTL